MKKKQSNTTLEPEDLKILNKIVEKQKISKSWFIRTAVSEKLINDGYKKKEV